MLHTLFAGTTRPTFLLHFLATFALRWLPLFASKNWFINLEISIRLYPTSPNSFSSLVFQIPTNSILVVFCGFCFCILYIAQLFIQFRSPLLFVNMGAMYCRFKFSSVIHINKCSVSGHDEYITLLSFKDLPSFVWNGMLKVELNFFYLPNVYDNVNNQRIISQWLKIAFFK